MLCYAIVVTYNGSKWINACFSSLLKSTVPLKILAIDNGSTDNTTFLLRENYPSVEVVELRENLGFGGANNIGLRIAHKARADFIFLLNQDGWVEHTTIEKLIAASRLLPEYGIVSPVHLNGAGDSLDYGFLNYLCNSNAKNHISDFYIKPRNALLEIYQLDFINAAFWLLPRSTIELVGGFNTYFFQYGEDQDYVNRCHFFGLKVGFVPFTFAFHDRTQYDSDSKKKIVSRTSVLAKLFSPIEGITIQDHLVMLLVSILKSLLRFRMGEVVYLLKELGYYFANRKTIVKIADNLKKPGMTFLEETIMNEQKPAL